ncbi:transposable element Tcb2 transposase [Trichonephila clavipes]|uniref:Transposable element Tcb2 transposase n=1 Tax=Trichonephila clavipes TaxID=2585209 RepID=A0A8X6SGB9_TRICX|nr:transposable element Tcb2 transposase [Trichonephila clavipes]
MPLRRFRRQSEQLSQFERGRIIGMMEAGWSAKRVARQLRHSDCVVAPSLGTPVSSRTIRRRLTEGHLGSRVLPLTPPIDVFGWSGATYEDTGLQVVLSNESRFNLCSDDNRVHVWKSRGERPNPAFALQRHTAPTAGVMIAQRYVHDILLQPHVLALLQRLPGALFQQDNARPHTARVSQDCLRTVTTFLVLPHPQICLQSSIYEIIWNGELDILRV